jgi:hypothetical protein
VGESLATSRHEAVGAAWETTEIGPEVTSLEPQVEEGDWVPSAATVSPAALAEPWIRRRKRRSMSCINFTNKF